MTDRIQDNLQLLYRNILLDSLKHSLGHCIVALITRLQKRGGFAKPTATAHYTISSKRGRLKRFIG